MELIQPTLINRDAKNKYLGKAGVLSREEQTSGNPVVIRRLNLSIQIFYIYVGSGYRGCKRLNDASMFLFHVENMLTDVSFSTLESLSNPRSV